MPSPNKYYAPRDDWRPVRGRNDAFQMRGVGTLVRCEGRSAWRFLPDDPARQSFIRSTLEDAMRAAEATIVEVVGCT